MSKDRPILVCGSTHIDIIAKAFAPGIATIKPGSIAFDIGGPASNIATAIKDIGIPVQILTALAKNSPYTDIIVERFAGIGIHLHLQTEDGLLDAAFCAHLNEDGSLHSAISSMPVEQVKFCRDIFEPAIDGARAAIIDCSLSAEMIAHLSSYANSVNVPTFISVATEEKACRIAGINTQFSGLFISRQGMICLAKHLRINPSAFTMSRHFNCPVVVTNGNNGAILAQPSDTDMLHFDAAGTGDVGGGKDHMTAHEVIVAHTIAHYVVGGRKLKEAIVVAMVAADESAACRKLGIRSDGGMTEVMQLINNAAALDHLTNLPNRATATKKLEQIASKNTNCFVAMLDIDMFKQINDTYGHDVGDLILKKVAETISSVMRESDFCARWGGEEFLCVIGKGVNTLQEAWNVMERTRIAVESILWEHGKITISIGVSKMDNDGISKTIKRADEALYESKRNGRNMVSMGSI